MLCTLNCDIVSPYLTKRESAKERFCCLEILVRFETLKHFCEN